MQGTGRTDRPAPPASHRRQDGPLRGPGPTCRALLSLARKLRYRPSLKQRRRIVRSLGLLGAALGFVTCWQTAALAHHSWSRYDSGEVVTIEGEVTKVEWASPHVFMYFTATAGDGTATDWTMEMDPPTLLGRYGLRHDTIRPGMTIKVTGVRARSGAPVMRAVTIELEDGTVQRVSSRV